MKMLPRGLLSSFPLRKEKLLKTNLFPKKVFFEKSFAQEQNRSFSCFSSFSFRSRHFRNKNLSLSDYFLEKLFFFTSPCLFSDIDLQTFVFIYLFLKTLSQDIKDESFGKTFKAEKVAKCKKWKTECENALKLWIRRVIQTRVYFTLSLVHPLYSSASNAFLPDFNLLFYRPPSVSYSFLFLENFRPLNPVNTASILL